MQIGRVQASHVASLISPFFDLTIDRTEKLSVGDIIEFHNARCVITYLRGEKILLVKEHSMFAYEGLCMSVRRIQI
jgi:hypothetical protein